ncbi:MAG: hypothetical protein HOW73_33900 [Polyangiaceae bacterium]|nr:hypothetical protein [Polyangiaceae bacterium]
MTDVNEDAPDEVDAVMATLRAEYAERLPELVTELRVALEALRNGDITEQAVRTPRVLAHRLYGTAGSYEFDRISEAASAIETQLLSCENAGKLPDDAAWQEIARALHVIEAEVAAAMETKRS